MKMYYIYAVKKQLVLGGIRRLIPLIGRAHRLGQYPMGRCGVLSCPPLEYEYADGGRYAGIPSCQGLTPIPILGMEEIPPLDYTPHIE